MKKVLLTLSLLGLGLTQGNFNSQFNVGIMENQVDAPLLDVLWCGEKKNTVFLLTEKNSLYMSTDQGKMGERLTEHLEKLGKKELTSEDPDSVGQVSSIIQSPVDQNMMLLLGTEGINWITEDCGATFRAMNQGRKVEEFQFHPTERTWLLASAWTKCEDFPDQPCKAFKELFVSKDLGNNWEHIGQYIFQFAWGRADATHTKIPKERIVIAHEPAAKGHQKVKGWSNKLQIAYSDDFFTTQKPMVAGGNKFLLTKYFVFVVQVKSEDGKEINLLIADPKERDYTFKPIELPLKRLFEHSYTILETSEHSIFLNINHDGENSRFGSIYVSDSTGVRYSLALPGNVRSIDGQCDFEKVQGIEGIYLANVYENDVIKSMKKASSNNFPQQKAGAKGKKENVGSNTNEADLKALNDIKKTMISFNQGGSWQSLTPPERDSEGKKIVCISDEYCKLHLHSYSSTNFGPFYTTKNSLGMIIATGNIGQYLSQRPDETNTYLSRDGGLTWFEIAKGSHIYEIGDHGSIIVIAPDQHATQEVYYSWNEGLTWETLKISDEPMQVANIIMEPTNTAEKFIVYGTSKKFKNKGAVVAIDFTPLHQRWCQGQDKPDTTGSDYETWTPNGPISPKCLLGSQVAYIRKKREAECFNNEENEKWTFINNCQCTEADWECDFGFSRVGSGSCLPADDKIVNQTRGPPEECHGHYFITQGYRKIGGDQCVGGVRHDPIRVPCPGMSTFNSQNMGILLVLVIAVMGMIWMSNKGNSERVKSHFDKLYKKFSMRVSRSIVKRRPEGFRSIEETPESLREDDDEFGKIVFEETEDKAEVIEDVVLLEVGKGKRMTERKGLESANRQVPVISGPGEKRHAEWLDDDY